MPRAVDMAAEMPLAASLQVETAPDSLHFLLQVTNASEQPVQLTFPTGQSFDFHVLQEGREIWRWSADQMFTQAIRTETMAPSETRSFDAAWRPTPGLQGRLTVRARLTAEEFPIEQETEVDLP